ncbi:MAG: hypothetical protein ACPKQO_00430 [Nitrososphaeraceae archaeon]
MKYLYITILIITFSFIYFNNDIFVFGQDEFFNENPSKIIRTDPNLKAEIVTSGLDFPTSITFLTPSIEEKTSEEIIITKINTNDSIINIYNPNDITNYEMTPEEKELQNNNKTVKIIPEIEYNESIKDRILVTADVVDSYYSYNETDFYTRNDEDGKKEIEIEIPVLKNEKFVEVCVLYYEGQHGMICKQLDIENKNILRSKFNLEEKDIINNYYFYQ